GLGGITTRAGAAGVSGRPSAASRRRRSATRRAARALDGAGADEGTLPAVRDNIGTLERYRLSQLFDFLGFIGLTPPRMLPQLGIHLDAAIVSAIIAATIGGIVLLVILRLVNRGGRW